MSSTIFKNEPKNSDDKVNIVKQLVGNRNPKDVFYEECQRRGVDPQSILGKINM